MIALTRSDKRKQIRMTVSHELHAWLAREGKRTGCPIAAIVRSILIRDIGQRMEVEEHRNKI